MPTISPELVLVDPELARYARARLPDLPSSNGNGAGANVLAIAAAPSPPHVVGAGAVTPTASAALPLPLIRIREAALAEAEAEAEAEPPPRKRGRRLLVAAGCLAVFVVGLVIPPFFAGTEPVLRQPRPRSVHPASAGIGAAVSRPAVPATTRARHRPAARRRVPTRLFVWLPQRRASFYRVRFLSGRRTVFEAWPTVPRVTVPIRGTFRGRPFAFTSGRYRWIVQPALGPRDRPRYLAPIVRSVWVVAPG